MGSETLLQAHCWAGALHSMACASLERRHGLLVIFRENGQKDSLVLGVVVCTQPSVFCLQASVLCFDLFTEQF